MESNNKNYFVFQTTDEYCQWYKREGHFEHMALTEDSQRVHFGLDYSKNPYMTFIASKPGATILSESFLGTLEISKDLITWETVSAIDWKASGTGDTLYVRTKNNPPNNLLHFTLDNVEVHGNVQSLVDYDNMECDDCTSYDSGFFTGMFKGNHSVTDWDVTINPYKFAPDCSEMFADTNIEYAPALDCESTQPNCYNSMFKDCADLVDAQVLPAEFVANSAYKSMFENCTSLETPADLNATTIGREAFDSMYKGCTSLKNVPSYYLDEIPLRAGCYAHMFQDCTSLEVAPYLPYSPDATNSPRAYEEMFAGCTSLHEMSIGGDTWDYAQSNDWVRGVPDTGTFYDNAPSGIDVQEWDGVPYGWEIIVPKQGIWIEALNDPITVSVNLNSTTHYEYSMDEGATWHPYNTPSVLDVEAGNRVYFRATDTTTANGGAQFKIEGKCDVGGRLMSLTGESMTTNAFKALFKDCKGLRNANELTMPSSGLTSYCFAQMFEGCNNLEKAPSLPAVTLATQCYAYMFNGCESLRNAPVLPATTLTPYCYTYMFAGCENIIPPALPALTLAEGCYSSMFYNCQNLLYAPELPATTLAPSCYKYMFYNNLALRGMPDLPATTLQRQCYSNMFGNCKSLTTSSVLPANTLVADCYNAMFKGCTSLNDVTTHAKAWNTNYTQNWLDNVAPTGTLHQYAEANIPIDTPDGTPVNWTPDYIKEPLTVTWRYGMRYADSVCGLIVEPSNYPYYYSEDGGATWVELPVGTTTFQNKPNGWAIQIRHDGPADGTLRIYGNPRNPEQVMLSGSLLSLNNDSSILTKPLAFSNLFAGWTTNYSSLDARDLDMSFTQLTEGCFSSMFISNSCLSTAPSIPKTDVVPNMAYMNMFNGCNNLTWPTTTVLKPTSVGERAFAQMYMGTGITNGGWFELKNLGANACVNMYNGCHSLNELHVYVDNWDADTFANWVYSVAPSGTFYNHGKATNWPLNNDSGVPLDWVYKKVTPPFSIQFNCDPYTELDTHASITINGYNASKVFWSRNQTNWVQYDGSPIYLDSTDEVFFKNKEVGEGDITFQFNKNDGKNVEFKPTGDLSAMNGGQSGITSDYMFANLFENCKYMYDARELIVTPSDKYMAYGWMFANCTDLMYAPETVGGSSVGKWGMQCMFKGCTSLTMPPAIPAQIVGEEGFMQMFEDCKSLEATPELYAESGTHSYYDMFNGCSSLHEATTYFTSWSATQFENWMANVPEEGTFFNYGDASIVLNSPNGIPYHWEETRKVPYAIWFKAVSGTPKLRVTFNYTLQRPEFSENGKTWTRISSPFEFTLDSKAPRYLRGHGVQSSHVTALNTDEYAVGGDLSSWADYTDGSNTWSWSSMFAVNEGEYASLVDASELYLWSYDPADPDFSPESSGTWYRFFADQRKLKYPPKPITVGDSMGLPSNTFKEMFKGCTSLTKGLEFENTIIPSERVYLRVNKTCTGIFQSMYEGCTSLTQAPNWQYVVRDDYYETGYPTDMCKRMFYGCTALTKGMGSLGALTQADPAGVCAYEEMYAECTSLTDFGGPLDLTFLSNESCQRMFWNCSSLKSISNFYLCQVGEGACMEMFYHCTSLISVDPFVWVGLAENKVLYTGMYGMFEGCTNLEVGLNLNTVTTIGTQCFARMYYGCTKLKYLGWTLNGMTFTPDENKNYIGGSTELQTETPWSIDSLCELMFAYSGIQRVYLPARNSYNLMYEHMFEGCTTIKNIYLGLERCIWNDYRMLQDWLIWASSTGTLHTIPEVQDLEMGTTSGCPTGWTLDKTWTPVIPTNLTKPDTTETPPSDTNE